jgi:Flp pilus assembly protein TadD
VTLAAQRAGGTVATLEEYPLGTRLANAPVAVIQYLGQLVWPTKLAVFYPHPGASIPPGQVAGAVLLLASFSVAAAAAWRKRPWALVGWLWFLVGLAPVIGVVQVGWQARADRYTYTPFIGLFVLLVWAGAEAAERYRHGRVLALVAAAGTLVGCGLLTHRQAATWRSTEALFQHALSVTRENPVAHQELARVLIDQGRAQEAIPHLLEALRVRPDYVDALASLGQVRAMQGQWDGAAAAFAEAARLRPADATSLNNLALARMRQGDFPAAESTYRRAAAAAPRWAEPEHALGVLLLLRGAEAEALERLRRATSLSPDRADLRDHWEGALAMRAAPDSSAARRLACHLASLRVRASLTVWGRGDAPAAVTMLRTTIGQEPRCVEPHLQLGILLASLGRRSEARAALEQALTLAPDSPGAQQALRELSLTESARPRP